MKRVPLKRKVSLSDSFRKKLKAAGMKLIFARNRVTRQKPLKKLSRSKRTRMAAYMALRTAFLSREENRPCRCCLIRREHGENIRQQESTEIHHQRGRIGRLLTDERFFVPTCYDCGRHWIHQNPTRARELNLLAPPAQWNVFPVDGK